MKNHTVIIPNLSIASLALLLSGCASEPIPAPVAVAAPIIVQAPVLSG